MIYYPKRYGGGKVSIPKYTIALSALLLLLITSSIVTVPSYGQTSDPAIPVFDGIWETEVGRMALWQADDTVWGVYGTIGEIGGTINEDGVLNFNYTLGASEWGRGRMRMNDDARSFSGSYQSTAKESEHGDWNGTWFAANTFDVGDRNALEYIPTNIPPELGENTTPEEPAIPEETEQPEPVAVASSAWTGAWDTNLGYIETTASGSAVTGTFGYDGVLTGTARDNALNATWSMSEYDGTELTGEAFFEIGADGLSFRGNYLITGDGVWLAWHGTKTSPRETDTEFSFGVTTSEAPTSTTPSVETEHGEVSPITETSDTSGSDLLLNNEETAPSIETEEPPELASTDGSEESEESEESNFTLKLTAHAECWVTVRNRDGKLFTGMMLEDEVKEFEDAVGFYLKAGRPEILDVVFNGDLMKWEEFTFDMNLPKGVIIYEPPPPEPEEE